MTDIDLGKHYERARVRIGELVRPLMADQAATPVQACPGWTVHDVLAHLVGLVEDAIAGRLQGIPTEEQTDLQVARHYDSSIESMLATWAELSPLFSPVIRDNEIWPAVLDACSHEHDMRAALNQPGDRELDTIRLGAIRLLGSIDIGARVTTTLDDGTVVVAGAGDDAYELETTAFEAFRFRLGRRSRKQVAGLSWTPDPTSILDGVCVFGPASMDLIE
jgi:uncharacterized protein (TIGR03083 family)